MTAASMPPDLPGSGESDAPEQTPVVADHAAAFADLIDSLRLKQVDVVGYQAGALAAIELALARPEQVRRLILIGVPSSDSGYQVGERLPLLKLPVMILRARDEFWESTGRTEALLRDARRAELADPTGNVLDADAENRAVRARLLRSLALSVHGERVSGVTRGAGRRTAHGTRHTAHGHSCRSASIGLSCAAWRAGK
ncbi:MAG: alpha/beta hydrolase [Proteobacteria bacterium]|nr:alpha/beta hydrolase [Pseudomonadota bacterium]